MKERVAVLLLAALASLTACGGASEQPPGTVGAVPLQSGVDTLLPVVVGTLPPDDTGTLAPDTLFGGDPCSALVADDFASITFAGRARGQLVSASLLGEDTCGYDITVDGDEYMVLVRALAADDFDHPVTTAQAIDKFSNLGEEAIGVARGDDSYEVIVRVGNGYFSVTTPDKGSARALAAAAVEHVLQV